MRITPLYRWSIHLHIHFCPVVSCRGFLCRQSCTFCLWNPSQHTILFKKLSLVDRLVCCCPLYLYAGLDAAFFLLLINILKSLCFQFFYSWFLSWFKSSFHCIALYIKHWERIQGTRCSMCLLLLVLRRGGSWYYNSDFLWIAIACLVTYVPTD
jgi:hypothetical protein